MKNGKEKHILKVSGNAFGDAAQRINRKAAIKNLDRAQELEQERKRQGWVYLSKEKTAKLVSPERLPGLIAEGWRKK